jgi:hypothetical protein
MAAATRGAGGILALRGLSIACFALYAVVQVGLVFPSWIEFVATQQEHGQDATVFGQDGFIWFLMEQTSQNWQSEFLALGVLVTLTSVLLHVGSKHSRDGNDEVQHRVETIQRRVDALAEKAS